MSAIALGALGERGNSRTADAPQDLQSLHPLTRASGWRAPDLQAPGSLAAQGDFRPIHLEDLRIAAGSAAARGNGGSRKESQFHQAAGILTRKIDAIENGGVAPVQVDKGAGKGVRRNSGRNAIDTQLHLGFSISESEILVKRPAFFPPIFFPGHLITASKCYKM